MQPVVAIVHLPWYWAWVGMGREDGKTAKSDVVFFKGGGGGEGSWISRIGHVNLPSCFSIISPRMDTSLVIILQSIGLCERTHHHARCG